MREVAWIILSIVAFFAALLATLPTVSLIGSTLSPAGDLHLLQMALWPIVWGTFALAAVWLLGRALLGFPRLHPTGLALAVTGVGLAAWHHVVLQLWGRAHLGYYDPDMIGPTAGLFAVLVGIGVAAFGSYVAPRGVLWVPGALVVLGTLGVLVIAAGNAIAGAPNGIAADSIPLAVSIGAAVAYAVAASVLVVVRALRPANG